MRDRKDNVVIICSIENFDPMGVHTGDSITVAPAQTLTDKEYQLMRDAAIAIIREIGVETGGCNIQFAVEPARRAHGRHRDEPARLALLGPGVEGHGLPDRQDRRQARRRLHARRDPQRHHAARRRPSSSRPSTTGGEDPALGVREVPRRRPDAHHADEVGRRGDGHRPHVQGGAPEGLRSLEIGRFGLGCDRKDRRLSTAPCRPSTTIRRKLAMPNAEPHLLPPLRAEGRRRRRARSTSSPASTRGSSTTSARSSRWRTTLGRRSSSRR